MSCWNDAQLTGEKGGKGRRESVAGRTLLPTFCNGELT